MDLDQLVRQIPLFRGLSAEEITPLWAQCQKHKFAPGETVIRQGEPGQGLFLLTEGMVAIRVTTFHGEERTLVHLGAGQVLGEIALLDGGPHTANAVAVQPTEVILIPSQVFWSFCEQRHPAGVKLLRNLAADVAFKLRHTDLSVV